MVNRLVIALILSFLISGTNSVIAEQQSLPDSTWFEIDQQDNYLIHIYFFWSKKCPHCLDALPFVTELAESNSDIRLHSLQLIGEEENIRRYQYMAMKLGQTAQSVPALLFCNSMRTGFDTKHSPEKLIKDIDLCRKYLNKSGNLKSFQYEKDQHLQIELPFIGPVSTNNIDSLPLITLILASIDAFNPCAFFVLMFLLSMMLHTHNRARMILVGGVFVFVSGLMYFLFMTAWLNLFRVIGQLDIITLIAGSVALIIGLINVKDFFWFKQGVSISITDSSRQTLFHRMRDLLKTGSISGVLLATVGLALFANLYEFLCTAGFPMIYTRILTLTGMPEWKYYLYLLFYNLIYILPLMTIVIIFSWTMGARKLQENEGRKLKFISGLMMVSLGLILLVAPQMLQNIVVTGIVLLTVILISVIIINIEKRYKK